MPAPDVVTGGEIAAEAVRSVVGQAVAIGGTLWALSRLNSFLGPLPGPRVRSGELSAREASARAANAYWAAEETAAQGKCRAARVVWKKAEDYRARAEERAARGDHTGRDLRRAVRHARKQLQLNCRRT